MSLCCNNIFKCNLTTNNERNNWRKRESAASINVFFDLDFFSCNIYLAVSNKNANFAPYL